MYRLLRLAELFSDFALGHGLQQLGYLTEAVLVGYFLDLRGEVAFFEAFVHGLVRLYFVFAVVVMLLVFVVVVPFFRGFYMLQFDVELHAPPFAPEDLRGPFRRVQVDVRRKIAAFEQPRHVYGLVDKLRLYVFVAERIFGRKQLLRVAEPFRQPSIVDFVKPLRKHAPCAFAPAVGRHNGFFSFVHFFVSVFGSLICLFVSLGRNRTRYIREPTRYWPLGFPGD